MEKTSQHKPVTAPLLTAAFAGTIFLSATLLFSIQPLVGKQLLPLLGGAPAVWNTVMVFFQAMLLAGYAYAHLSVRACGLKGQPSLHLALFAIAAGCVPFTIGSRGTSDLQTSHPAMWALGRLAATLGIPVFVLASTAPLLQKWFASTRHRAAKDPYFLYAASNIGSFGALFAYPLLIEPFVRLQVQTKIWSYGFWLLGVCMAGCVCLRRANSGDLEESSERLSREQVGAGTMLKWIGLSFLPSSLMLGVTTYITTDVASIPLLWVLPLALYLLTFVIAFGKASPRVEMLNSRALPILALAVVFPILMQATEPVLVLVLLHLIFFFIGSLQCHLKLARSRPATNQLTAFYLYLSLGGVLGGIFNALLAPLLFHSVVEYPLAIIAVTLVGYPGSAGTRKQVGLGVAVVAWMAVGSVFIAKVGATNVAAGNIVAGVLLLAAFLFVRGGIGYALALGSLLVCTNVFRQNQSRILERDRNFFGVLRVSDDADKPLRRLFHGTTIHGVQFRVPERRCEPLSYYHSEGPVSEIAKLFESTTLPRNVGLVGLGAGAMMTYAKPDQHWTLYEIDPAVIRIAQDTNLFTYLGACAGSPFRFELGDARLGLEKTPDAHMGLILLDAFSSDVIPMHLLTVEAVRLYQRKLAPGGIVAFHLSSRHFELEPLVAKLGDAVGLRCFASTKGELSAEAVAEGGLESNWAILVPDATVPHVLRQTTWKRVAIERRAPLWTDDFSSLLGVLKVE